MTAEHLAQRFAELCREDIPRPGQGATPERHRRILAAGREDLSLAKLIEAHWDAVAILGEAGREPAPGAKYAVWASEVPGSPLGWDGHSLTGTKRFCSGAGLVDRALVSAGPVLVELDLSAEPSRLQMDGSQWQTEAFRLTQTATLTFDDFPVSAVVGTDDWYIHRHCFWQGACGPAAAWAGGAAGLVDKALEKAKDDPHTMAHLGAMQADLWAMQQCLDAAGNEFDANPDSNALVTALAVRHIVEQGCTDILRRFARAFGPAPLAMDREISRRYAELELYLRQSHGEQDLESLGRACKKAAPRS